MLCLLGCSSAKSGGSGSGTSAGSKLTAANPALGKPATLQLTPLTSPLDSEAAASPCAVLQRLSDEFRVHEGLLLGQTFSVFSQLKRTSKGWLGSVKPEESPATAAAIGAAAELESEKAYYERKQKEYESGKIPVSQWLQIRTSWTLFRLRTSYQFPEINEQIEKISPGIFGSPSGLENAPLWLELNAEYSSDRLSDRQIELLTRRLSLFNGKNYSQWAPFVQLSAAAILKSSKKDLGEDERVCAFVLRKHLAAQILQITGYRAIVGKNGSEALEKLSSSNPELKKVDWGNAWQASFDGRTIQKKDLPDRSNSGAALLSDVLGLQEGLIYLLEISPLMIAAREKAEANTNTKIKLLDERATNQVLEALTNNFNTLSRSYIRYVDDQGKESGQDPARKILLDTAGKNEPSIHVRAIDVARFARNLAYLSNMLSSLQQKNPEPRYSLLLEKVSAWKPAVFKLASSLAAGSCDSLWEWNLQSGVQKATEVCNEKERKALAIGMESLALESGSLEWLKVASELVL